MPSTTPGKRPAPRRTLRFRSLSDLRADLDAIERAHAANSLRSTAGWTPAQVLEHLAIFIEAALDGFPPSRIPWLLRAPANLLFRRAALAGRPPPPALPIPRAVAFLHPDPSTPFDAALARLHRALARLDAGERFTHPSPLFGPLTHEQWTALHLGHAAHHLSFLILSRPRTNA